METAFVLLIFLIIGTTVAFSIRQNIFLPRKRRVLLANELSRRFGLKVNSEDKITCLEGTVEGHSILINISDGGNSVVQVNLLKPAFPVSYRVYETTGWSYQKWENRAAALTIDSGDSAFDARYDVYDDIDKEAARKLSESVRKVLVERHRKGLAVLSSRVTLGDGAVTPYGYFGGSAVPDSVDQTTERLRQALAIASALEACA